jgi:hypothetical protein
MVTIQTLFASDTGVTFVVQYTAKKENKIFLIYDEIQGSLARSYVTDGLSPYMTKYLRNSSYMYSIRKPLLIYDFAPGPF